MMDNKYLNEHMNEYNKYMSSASLLHDIAKAYCEDKNDLVLAKVIEDSYKNVKEIIGMHTTEAVHKGVCDRLDRIVKEFNVKEKDRSVSDYDYSSCYGHENGKVTLHESYDPCCPTCGCWVAKGKGRCRNCGQLYHEVEGLDPKKLYWSKYE